MTDTAVDEEERHRLTAVQGLAALSLDALSHRSIAPPIVKYLSQIEAEDSYHRLVVLIPEVQPRGVWYALLFNQRGVILDRAIRRGTANVVLCRLRYRLDQLAPGDAPAAVAAPPPATMP